MADGAGCPLRSARPLRAADLFCGSGGTSTGVMRAVRALLASRGVTTAGNADHVDLVAINHWPVAIETHRRNHPGNRPLCADLEHVLPRDAVPGGVLDLLAASPTCTFHSRARGGRPVHDQQRMDPWHVVRWCTDLRVHRLMVENVPEFIDWGPCDARTGRPIARRKGEYFRAWCDALRAIGFRVDWRVLCAADYGDPTTRRRFFLIGRSDRGPLRWPKPSHAAAGGADLLDTRDTWRGASEIIDWSLPGTSIFTRKKPLVPNTVRRFLSGAQRHGWPQPYLDALQALLDGRQPVLDVPAGDAAPLLVTLRGTHALANAAALASEPLRTLTASGTHVGILTASRSTLGAEPLLMGTHGGATAKPVACPVPTITTGGAGSTLRPGCARPQLLVPLIAPYYGAGSGETACSVAAPLPTVTTKGRFGLVQPVAHPQPSGYRIDSLYRMLTWRELARAMSFDDEGEVYDFAGTGTEIVKQIGNAVPVRLAKALAQSLLEDWS